MVVPFVSCEVSGDFGGGGQVEPPNCARVEGTHGFGYQYVMDLFGKALRAFHHGKSDAEMIITRDDGWQDAHSPGLYFAPEPFDFERPALAHVQGPILDVRCGAGRHVAWLQAQGRRAFGVDASQGAVEVCQARGLTDVYRADVMRGAIPDLPAAPETITLFGNNVGIGGTCAGSVRLLRKLHTICAQGGRLILTGLDVRKTENPVHLEYHAANLAKGRRRGEITIRLAYDGEADAPFDWFHPEPYEVEEIAAQSGWTITRLEPRGAFFWAVLKRD